MKSLKYEDPWLAAATADGSVLLIDVESSVGTLNPPVRQRSRPVIEVGKKQKAARQRLNVSQGGALCVDIQDNYVACGAGLSFSLLPILPFLLKAYRYSVVKDTVICYALRQPDDLEE